MDFRWLKPHAKSINLKRLIQSLFAFKYQIAKSFEIVFIFKQQKMKALTIRQPWAHLIVLGMKNIENRSWKTNYCGRIYVHAALNTAHGIEPIARYLYSEWKHLSPDFRHELAQTSFIKSAIIGEVDIIDCVQNHHSVWAEQEGWNWVLANAVRHDKPILNVKGGLSLWEFESL
jgi:hypothetical protein